MSVYLSFCFVYPEFQTDVTVTESPMDWILLHNWKRREEEMELLSEWMYYSHLFSGGIQVRSDAGEPKDAGFCCWIHVCTVLLAFASFAMNSAWTTSPTPIRFGFWCSSYLCHAQGRINRRWRRSVCPLHQLYCSQNIHVLFVWDGRLSRGHGTKFAPVS